MTQIAKKVGLLLSVAAFPALLAVPMASAEAGGYHKRSHSYNQRHYSYRDYGRHHGGRSGNDVAVGLIGGIIGLAVGSAIANNQNRSSDRVVVRERVVTPPSTWRDPDSYGYSDYGSDNGWYQPVSQQQPISSEPASTCLQAREYQTQITVGGKDVEAYGTACLQPDGSWKFGAPTPEPQ